MWSCGAHIMSKSIRFCITHVSLICVNIYKSGSSGSQRGDMRYPERSAFWVPLCCMVLVSTCAERFLPLVLRVKTPSNMSNYGPSFLLSNANDTNPEEDSVVSNDFSTALGAFILSLVFLVGVPGNLFIVWSILARIRRRSVTTLLILNLACADGFLMALTIFFIVYLAKQTWVFGHAMCKGLFYLCNTNMYASIFLITLMSVHRLVIVVLPRRVSSMVSRKIVKRVIIGMWALVMLISIPSLVFRDVREDKDEKNKTRLVCAPMHTEPRHVRFQYSLETVAGFILPYAVIITSYVLILRRLRQTKFRRKVRSEKLILAIVVMFGMFWLPYHVINMIQVAAEWYAEDSPTREILDHISKSSRAVTSALAFISSCANPVLYTFAGKSYIKKNGLAFMARLFEGTSSDQTGNKKSRVMGKDNVGNSTVHCSNTSGIREDEH